MGIYTSLYDKQAFRSREHMAFSLSGAPCPAGCQLIHFQKVRGMTTNCLQQAARAILGWVNGCVPLTCSVPLGWFRAHAEIVNQEEEFNLNSLADTTILNGNLCQRLHLLLHLSYRLRPLFESSPVLSPGAINL